MSLQGRFATMAVADLLQWAGTARKSGTLTVRTDDGLERKLIFRNGSIVASSSSSSREHLGRYLAAAGLARESQVRAALDEQRRTRVLLAAILVRHGVITDSQAALALRRKTIEDSCDLFLLADAGFAFDPRLPAFAGSITVTVDVTSIVMEGVRRIDEWHRIRGRIAPTHVFVPTGEGWPPPSDEEDESWEDRDMAGLILPHLGAHVSVAELVALLPFSRYKVYRGIVDLLGHAVIRRLELEEAAEHRAQVESAMEIARGSVERGAFGEALSLLEGLAQAEPGHAAVDEELAKVRAGYCRAIYQLEFGPKEVPRALVALQQASHLAIGASDGFVLSRIDGRLSVEQILKISALSEIECLRSLKRLHDAKLIDFPRPVRADW